MRWVREPLVHFVTAGLVLCAIDYIYHRHNDPYTIEVTPERVDMLLRRYALQFGAMPDARTRGMLISREIHDEILFREGLALDLNKDDEIVRRRVVQKMQFLLQDTHAPPEPTEAQIRAYYDAHIKNYIEPARVAFSHIFFSTLSGGDPAARTRAKAVASHLSNTITHAPNLGDPFPDLYDFSNYEPEQVRRLFGHTEISDAVFSALLRQWSGPYRSSYGWHLIYVNDRTDSRERPLAEIYDRVRSDFLQDEQNKANDAAFADLSKKFTIIREDERSK